MPFPLLGILIYRELSDGLSHLPRANLQDYDACKNGSQIIKSNALLIGLVKVLLSFDK